MLYIKQIRELLDVEGTEGVGSYKKLTAHSKSRSVSPKEATVSSRDSNSPIHSTKKILNNGMNHPPSTVSTSSITRGRAHTFEENGFVIRVGGQGRLSQDSMKKLLASLEASAQHATLFNSNLALRVAMERYFIFFLILLFYFIFTVHVQLFVMYKLQFPPLFMQTRKTFVVHINSMHIFL